jgi:hypothetical protein
MKQEYQGRSVVGNLASCREFTNFSPDRAVIDPAECVIPGWRVVSTIFIRIP